jgi:hypothetical protein
MCLNMHEPYEYEYVPTVFNWQTDERLVWRILKYEAQFGALGVCYRIFEVCINPG